MEKYVDVVGFPAVCIICGTMVQAEDVLYVVNAEGYVVERVCPECQAK